MPGTNAGTFLQNKSVLTVISVLRNQILYEWMIKTSECCNFYVTFNIWYISHSKFHKILLCILYNTFYTIITRKINTWLYIFLSIFFLSVLAAQKVCHGTLLKQICAGICADKNTDNSVKNDNQNQLLKKKIRPLQ